MVQKNDNKRQSQVHCLRPKRQDVETDALLFLFTSNLERGAVLLKSDERPVKPSKKGFKAGLSSVQSNLQSTLPNKIRFTNALYRARSHHQIKFLPQCFHDLALIFPRGY